MDLTDVGLADCHRDRLKFAVYDLATELYHLKVEVQDYTCEHI